MKIEMKPIIKETLFFIWLDAMALFVGWLVYDEISQAYQAIETQMATFSILGNIFFGLFGLFFPLLHIVCIIYHFKPDFFEKGVFKPLGLGGVMISLAGLVFAGCFILKIYVLYDIERSGYIYCEKQSHFITFTKELVFVKDFDDCR